MIAERFFGMRVHHFADFLDGGFAHLAFDAADDRCWAGARAARTCWPDASVAIVPAWAAGAGSAPATGEAPSDGRRLRAAGGVGREHAVDQRAGDEQADQERGDAHDARLR